ncbi:MAG: hypothetical protein JWL80_162 [Parcubacteria group bacterium]|nr:hypothetical protein [Parcubacteria group bacterium]
MNKKIIALIIVILLILLGAGGWYFFLRYSGTVPASTGPVVSPFGQPGEGNVTVSVNPDGTTGTTGLNDLGKPIARFFRITDTPIAGAIGFIKQGVTTIRYVDRATGHIFDVDPATLVKTQITNDTLPKIYEAVFRNDANAVVFRSLQNDSDTIDNLSLTLVPPKASSTDTLYTITSTPIRGQISELAAQNNTLLYTFKDSGAISASAFDGSKLTTLFNSDFTDWRLLSVGSSTALLITKPSSSAAGFAYTLPSKGGSLTKILGPLNALMITPRTDGLRLAYSYNNGAAAFSVQNTDKSITNLTPATLVDKCVWGIKNKIMLFCGVPTGGVGSDQPDNWYQGKTRFVDRIWRYNTDTTFTDILVDPKKDFNTDIDVMNPILTPDEDYLIFTNKNDLTLWALKLGQE